jgi:hypothetical protein
MKNRAKPQEKEYKTNQVLVRFTDKEYEALRLKAFKADLPLSVVVANAAKGLVVKEAITPEDRLLMRKLAGISNNLNQVATLANKDGYENARKRIGAVMDEINEILDKTK